MTNDFFVSKADVSLVSTADPAAILPCFLRHRVRLLFLFFLKVFPFPLLASFLLVCNLGVNIFPGSVLGALSLSFFFKFWLR